MERRKECWKYTHVSKLLFYSPESNYLDWATYLPGSIFDWIIGESQGFVCVARAAYSPPSCVLACYWSIVVCYWSISQSQTTTQLGGEKSALHKVQQHKRTLVTCIFSPANISRCCLPAAPTSGSCSWPAQPSTRPSSSRWGSSSQDTGRTLFYPDTVRLHVVYFILKL